ncbi:DUF2252 domain-containing protein [Diaminobutyricimonas sp. LJ205]|uniref:DUF2252 domain-containing protein n=1 Tax=Diaminobutyricimonas sp. LJ205 TaxID=2683590 RepID=UPI0012F502D5|nr:DUF2252 domain-containing protein [Diaminobutyricimonas sp. LJ205]
MTLEQPSPADSAARRRLPRSNLATLNPEESRADPVDLINAQAQTRYAEFVPVRHTRMAASAFAFYRGSAILMARDLAAQPDSGLSTQLCGDAHVANFGLFASPDRRLVFDVNDFDETGAGPFEWDVKRLATSFVLAARNSGLKPKFARLAAATVARAYREGMAQHARTPVLQVAYQRLETQRVEDMMRAEMGREGVRRVRAGVSAATARDSWSAVRKLTHVVDGSRVFLDSRPLLFRLPLEGEVGERVRAAFEGYRQSLPARSRELLDQFRIVDFGHKIVGVGSVGLYAWVLLLQGRTPDDLLILQIKQAERSVLDPLALVEPPDDDAHAGRRVVVGQQLMQAATDILLGWTSNVNGQFYYVRQLRDMKWSPELQAVQPRPMLAYAKLTATALALAHARASNPVPIAAYLGRSDTADRAFAEYALTYADRVEKDYDKFREAIESGRVAAE